MLDSFDRAKVGYDNIERHDAEVWNAAIEAAAKQVEHPGEPNPVSEGVRSLKREIRVSPCTCHPSEAIVPCQRRYAFSECKAAAKGEMTEKQE